MYYYKLLPSIKLSVLILVMLKVSLDTGYFRLFQVMYVIWHQQDIYVDKNHNRYSDDKLKRIIQNTYKLLRIIHYVSLMQQLDIQTHTFCMLYSVLSNWHSYVQSVNLFLTQIINYILMDIIQLHTSSQQDILYSIVFAINQ